MSKTEKVKRIQIQNKYINNKDFHFNSFYLLIILKMVCVNNHVNIYSTTLLPKLNWTRKTLKKYLDILRSENLIIYTWNSLPIHNPIELDIVPVKHNSKNADDYYTQVDIDTINRIIENTQAVKYKEKNRTSSKLETIERDEKEKSVKLFYLYEMFYNVNLGKAFISYTNIQDATKFSNTSIKKINSIFNRKGLVNIDIGEWFELNDKDGNYIKKIRGRNNYIPLCNRKY